MTDQQKQQIFALRKVGLTYAQIADGLKISVNTVKSLCHRSAMSKGLCKHCNAPLTQIPGRKPKSFCSDQCRRKWWNQHRDQINRKTQKSTACESCGKVFDSYAHARRKYCSHACYIRHRFGVP